MQEEIMVLLMCLPFPVLWEGKQRNVTYHLGASGFLYRGLLRLLCPLTLCDYVFSFLAIIDML